MLFRSYVDKLIIEITDEIGYPKELTVELKRKLLSIPTLDVVINGRRSPLMIAVTFTTSSLNKCYSGESRRLVYPIM